MLADGLVELGWVVDTPETNIVLAAVPDLELTLTGLRHLGVFGSQMAGKLRFVTHRDVTDADIKETLRRIASAS
jgi:threonine aldolase